MKLTVTAMLAAGLLATGCGGGDGDDDTVPQPHEVETTPRSTADEPSATPKAGKQEPLAAWCDLKLGDTKAEVLAVMGRPNGNKADAFKVAGVDSLEWNSGVTVLLASFEGGKATNLQAYDNQIGPQGSSRIDCESFRN